ncbi:MAG TPA: efflux transporter outer membrane subunit [Parvibaculum sp.]|jgi:multidrug efflux system outer membrane protein
MRAARLFSTASAVVLTLAVAGCNMAPDYAPPKVAVPAAYKEMGPWSPASPADDAPRGAWWEVFNDPTLNGFETQIETQSPRLAAAIARYDQARGLSDQARSSLFPSLDLEGSGERDRLSAHRPLQSKPAVYNDYAAGLSTSYELDVWGRVRNLVSQGKADEEASAADLASVRLSLQAELADNYLRLRGLDAEEALLLDTVDAYTRALKLANTRHSDGASSAIDVGRAETQLASTKAQLVDIGADRALLEHAIAVLVGEPASTFSIKPEMRKFVSPVVPVSAPSVLLQRRPDIAAAERRTAAANAGIGVQKAAFFPSITLGLSGGFESVGAGLLTAPSAFWALGPAEALLSVFDGGEREGKLAVAKGEFDEASANYRQTVLDGFREVEDQMALSNRLADEAKHQDDAVKAAARTNKLAFVRYREGAADYLEVVTAQTAELQAEVSALTVQTRRQQATVALIKALGGGWTRKS